MLDLIDKDRNVIPRWRPLVAIEKRDLSSLGRFRQSAPIHRAKDFRDQIAIWQSEGSLEAASDIFDTFLLTGDTKLLRLANAIFSEHQEQIPPRLHATLLSSHRPDMDVLDLRKAIAFRETDQEYLRKTIAVQKRRITEYPRDALAYLELARLHTICGHFEKADEELAMARRLAPENRVILRASLKFYHIISELKKGLILLRNSERIQFDPWIKSAEVATATTLNIDSRSSNKGLVSQLKDGTIARDSTELAMALATLDRMKGLPERQFFKLVRRALPKSTENGFAQAVWLSNHSSREFGARFPDAEPSTEAYEAKLNLAVSAKDFESAVGYAELWVEDQPFSKDAIIRYLNLRAVHVEPDERSVAIANRASSIFSDNWHVLNACLLLLVEAKQHDSAKSVLAKLKRETPSGASRAFSHAAEGFLAFSMGDFVLGRTSYATAAVTARKFKALDLLVNSSMFWLRCEVSNSLISRECTNEISLLINRALEKGTLADKNHLSNTWHSIEKRISSAEIPDMTEESTREAAVLETITENLGDPDMLDEPEFNL